MFIGATEFSNPDDEQDIVQIKIYLAAPKFTAQMDEFAHHGPSFVSDLKNYVLQHDRKALAELVQTNNGVIHIVLNQVKVALQHKVHFWLDARDRMS